MLYIPIIKTKMNEKESLRHLHNVFESNEIIPYLEICNHFDSINSKSTRQYLNNKGRLIRPLNFGEYCSLLPSGKPFYVGIMHGSERVAYSNHPYLLDLHLNEDEYSKELLRTLESALAIPVFEIRAEEEIPYAASFIAECRKRNRAAALRLSAITSNIVSEASHLLKENEFVFLEADIRGKKWPIWAQTTLTKLSGRIIVLDNSRRKEAVLVPGQQPVVWLQDVNDKKDFLKPDIAKDIQKWNQTNQLSLAGFSDFGSLKNDANVSSAGQTRKFAIFYDYIRGDYRVFSTATAKDQFDKIKPLVLADRPILDPNNICLGYEQLKNAISNMGNFGQWAAVCLTRYVHQVSLELAAFQVA